MIHGHDPMDDRHPSVIHLETSTHGRVLYDDAAGPSAGLIAAFHGYGQSAEDMLADVRQIPGVERWRIASVQALHRFYARDQQTVVASWMTRQDREFAIADNLDYVGKVIDRLEARAPALVFAGFSQGASMAYRVARLGRHHAAGIIALGGDIPPEVREPAGPGDRHGRWPPVLIGAGVRDTWFNQRLNGDIAFLTSHAIAHEIVRFDGGHEWTGEFRDAAGRWLAALVSW
jgi:predicted esterase